MSIYISVSSFLLHEGYQSGLCLRLSDQNILSFSTPRNACQFSVQYYITIILYGKVTRYEAQHSGNTSTFLLLILCQTEVIFSELCSKTLFIYGSVFLLLLQTKFYRLRVQIFRILWSLLLYMEENKTTKCPCFLCKFSFFVL